MKFDDGKKPSTKAPLSEKEKKTKNGLNSIFCHLAHLTKYAVYDKKLIAIYSIFPFFSARMQFL